MIFTVISYLSQQFIIVYDFYSLFFVSDSFTSVSSGVTGSSGTTGVSSSVSGGSGLSPLSKESEDASGFSSTEVSVTVADSADFFDFFCCFSLYILKKVAESKVAIFPFAALILKKIIRASAATKSTKDNACETAMLEFQRKSWSVRTPSIKKRPRP